MAFIDYINDLKSKTVAVIGVGISNIPLIEQLLAAGIDTTVHDKQTYEMLYSTLDRFSAMGIKLCLGDKYLDRIDADVIFRTPGIMPWNIAIKEAVTRGAVLTSEMEAFFELCPCEIIAITGSDGKTTTTTIISEILKREGLTVHIGGNIGLPLLCKVDQINPDDIVVLELSSFQLITMKESPNIAVVTNIAENHLDIHRDMEEYIEAKHNIIAFQDNSCRAVLNMDNSITREFARNATADISYFSSRFRVNNGVYLENGSIYQGYDGRNELIIHSRDILLPGLHNVENYMAAFAAVKGFASVDSMVDVAKTFAGVEHRIEFVRELRGVKYYNDSIASSPSRTMAGLRAFENKVILIAGGKDKGVGFEEFGDSLIDFVKVLVLTGLTAGKINEAVVNSPNYDGVPVIIMEDDFEQAVLVASEMACEGDIVILSPACTSFDRFKNFEDRGNTFKAIVNRLV